MTKRVVLITGGGIGIGRATSLAFADKETLIVGDGREKSEDQAVFNRLMRLGQYGEVMRAGLVEHRHQQGVVGRMRAAVVR